MLINPFDNRPGFIWLDGDFVPWSDAKLHVLTHGLHYASAVFEGERAYGGEIFKLREHTDRLIESGRFDPSPMTTHRFPFSQVERAFHMMETKEDGIIKPLITFG